MGFGAFQWGKNELTLLLNREYRDTWAITPAGWDEDGKILRGLPENNTILKDLEGENLGTWFGMTKKGRVVFLVDRLIKNGAFLWSPVDFLMGEMSPKDYAKQVCAFEPDSRELAYEMIVADINTNSMYHISKVEPMKPKVHYDKVGFGVHTLSSIAGFDNPYSRTEELLMKHIFNEIIADCKKEPVPTLNEMAKKFIYDPASEVEKSNFKTVSTTALVVKPSKEVMLYERYLVNGDWKEHDLEFKIE